MHALILLCRLNPVNFLALVTSSSRFQCHVSMRACVCRIEHDEEILLLEDERGCSGGTGSSYSSSAAQSKSTLPEPSAQGSLLTRN